MTDDQDILAQIRKGLNGQIKQVIEEDNIPQLYVHEVTQSYLLLQILELVNRISYKVDMHLPMDEGVKQAAIQIGKALKPELHNPRDTQFQGFADLLHKELLDINPRKYDSVKDFANARKQIIARRVYDLACHVIRSQAQGMDLLCMHDPEWMQERIDAVPDMTELPKEQE